MLTIGMEWQYPFCFKYYNNEDVEMMSGCGRWTYKSCITNVKVDSAGKNPFVHILISL